MRACAVSFELSSNANEQLLTVLGSTQWLLCRTNQHFKTSHRARSTLTAIGCGSVYI